MWSVEADPALPCDEWKDMLVVIGVGGILNVAEVGVNTIGGGDSDVAEVGKADWEERGRAAVVGKSLSVLETGAGALGLRCWRGRDSGGLVGDNDGMLKDAASFGGTGGRCQTASSRLAKDETLGGVVCKMGN